MKKIVCKTTFLLIALLVLAGCDYKIKESADDTTTGKEEIVSGAVVAAPIDNATVDAYIHGEWISVGVTKKGHIYFSDIEKIASYPVVLRANANGEGRNSKTGLLFKAELRGIMMSRYDIAYLTPVTTLAAIIFQLNGSTADAANTAKTKVTSLVQKTLGFHNVDPFANPLGDGLPKHEVLQQAFMVTLGLGEETDNCAMQSFIATITTVAKSMQNDTFAGAAKKVNPKLTTSIMGYITSQQTDIVRRASALLYDKEKNPIEQEKERIELFSTMNEIMTTGLRSDEVAESFVLAKIVDGNTTFERLPAKIATPQKTNIIPLTFQVSLLSNVNSVADLTTNYTKPLVPTYSGKFKISAVPATGTLNEGHLLSPIADQKVTAGIKTYTNGTEFSFFFDCKTVPIDSKQYITFTATDNPTVSYTITFIVKGQNTVVIESVESTGTSKLFAFDEGTNISIPPGAIATLADQQLAASVTPAFDTVTPEDVFDAVMVQFKTPEGFAFRGGSVTQTTAIVAILPTAANSTFTFALPSTIDIIATMPSPVGKKIISVEVLDQKTGTVVAQTSTAVYFVPEKWLGRVASVSVTRQPSSTITYDKDVADSELVLDPFILSCELKTWYDLAEVPKNQQPEHPIDQYPSIWKLRFDNAVTGNNGFKNAHGLYSTEINLQPYAYSLAQNPVKFEFEDFSSLGGGDCRLTIKPFTSSDTIRLYYAFSEDPENEDMATGSIIVMEQP